MNGSAPFEFQGHFEHFAFENALQTMRRHGLLPRRRRRNSLAPSTPERASLKQSVLVRTIKAEQGEPWFVARDICAVLDLTTSDLARDLARDLDDDERGVIDQAVRQRLSPCYRPTTT